MTGPPRDVRADAIRAFARRLAHEAAGRTDPDLLAREFLVILDGQQIGLVDLRRPTNPDADPFTRPTPASPDSDGLAQYRAARAAHAQKDQP